MRYDKGKTKESTWWRALFFRGTPYLIHRIDTIPTPYQHIDEIQYALCNFGKIREEINLIEVENLVKKYGSLTAVDDLSMKIEPGHIYGLLGKNGAGKTTTMNMVTGYIGATSGSVKVCGHDIFKEAEAAKKEIGYLPEIPPLYTDMSVYEYLDFCAELKGIGKKERDEHIVDVMEKAGISEMEHRLIRNLSKGYKQRVGLAQAILGNPSIIILDEPTVGLDPVQMIEMRDLIKELGKDHTVILSSHILSEVSAVCDYIYIIDHGKLVADFAMDEEKAASLEEIFIELTGKEDKE